MAAKQIIKLKKFVQETDTHRYEGVFVDPTKMYDKSQVDALLEDIRTLVSASNIWKNSVDTFSSIATTYPTPKEGWTVSVNDTNTIYRYDAATSTWIDIMQNSNSIATTDKNGLMGKEMVQKLNSLQNYVHPDSHPASMIIESNEKRFVTQAMIEAWNAIMSFPGFAGIGGYFGTNTKVARSDHRHERLYDMNEINFINSYREGGNAGNPKLIGRNWGLIGWGTNPNIVKRIQKGSGFEFKSVFSIALDTGNIYGYQYEDGQPTTQPRRLRFVDENVSIELLEGINSEWLETLKIQQKDFVKRWPTWEEISGKPTQFDVKSHTHVVEDISDIHQEWLEVLKQDVKPQVSRWPTWNEITSRPESFKPEAHEHQRITTDLTQQQTLGANLYAIGNSQSPQGFSNGVLDAANPNLTIFGNSKRNVLVSNQWDNSSHSWALCFTEDNRLRYAVNLLKKTGQSPEVTGNGWAAVQTIATLETPQNWTAYQDFQAGAGNTGSDLRFKRNIVPMSPVLQNILELDLIEYEWFKAGETTRNTFGVKAPQMEELGGCFSKMVHERPDEDKTKWIEYDRFGILAIKAIQEMHEINKQLINKLEKRIEELEAKLSSK